MEQFLVGLPEPVGRCERRHARQSSGRVLIDTLLDLTLDTTGSFPTPLFQAVSPQKEVDPKGPRRLSSSADIHALFPGTATSPNRAGLLSLPAWHSGDGSAERGYGAHRIPAHSEGRPGPQQRTGPRAVCCRRPTMTGFIPRYLLGDPRYSFRYRYSSHQTGISSSADDHCISLVTSNALGSGVRILNHYSHHACLREEVTEL